MTGATNEIINHDKMDLLKQKLSEMTEDELYSMFDIYHEKEVNLPRYMGMSTGIGIGFNVILYSE